MLGSGMIERLRALFGLPETPAPETTHVAELPRAAAALLALTARLDGSFDESERQAIERAMRERFGLAPADAEAVLSESRQGGRRGHRPVRADQRNQPAPGS